MQVHFLLHSGDGFHAACDEHIALTRDDALRGHRDGLQAGRAETINGCARHTVRHASTQSGLTSDVPAGRAFGVGAAHEHVIDLSGVDARALDRVLNGVAAERRAVGHVESALPALGQGGAGGTYDYCISHLCLLEFVVPHLDVQ